MTYIDSSNTICPTNWKKHKLHDLCTINYGQSPNRILDQDGIYPVVGTGGTTRKGKDYFIDGETVIIGRKGSIDKPYYYNEKIWVIDTAFFTSNHRNLDCKWLYYYLENSRLSRLNESTGVPSISRTTLYNLELWCPPILEQQKISKILSTWDHAIEWVRRLIEAKLLLRKELIQGLLTGRMRFPEFGLPLLQYEELPEGWQFMKIGKLVKRVKRPVEINPDQIYQEIGIRSHGKGIFHKEECLGKEIGTKKIFWVKPNTFVLNIVFAWEQAVSRTTYQEEGMVASHRFPMYQPLDDLLDLDYLVNFFLTRRGKSLLGLVSPGGAGRNKTLNQDAFRKLDIPVPPIGEQKRISSIIYDFDREIRILIRYNNVLITQKRALMQNLLSGEIRVKVE